ncbi:type IV toxin-antitoxin system AbiEi family antitoxin domain-containing protein [Nocardioidaceae bacterium]|nr:type IV toxin-antitoxin system AbiEi family antitoxin domain-containing protein [Nocardioidaceae bacterium]
MHPLHRVAGLLDQRHGVVSRRQLMAAGVEPHEIARLVRRREAVLAGRGVLVTHTGPLSWRQRVWTALLAISPAAADHHTAVTLAAGRDMGPHDQLHLARRVASSRRA